MSGNPLSIVAQWFATHLVAFSLLGYLVAGLAVSGVLDRAVRDTDSRIGEVASAGPGPSSTAAAVDTDPGDARQRRMPAQSEESTASPAVAAPGPGPGPGPGKEPMRKGPRLIGGSVPVYDDLPTDPQSPGTGSPRHADPFRPPTQQPGPAEPSMSRDAFLQRARRAFWNGDFEAAEAAYMDMLGAYPGDPDAFGELGNLYGAMGRPAQALDAYYEAGVRLKAAGEQEKLQQVIDILTKEADERSTRLMR